jgi:hypothetical protein
MANEPRLPPAEVQRAAGQVQAWLDQQSATPKPPEEIARMSFAERIDYCRRFPQSSLPPWRDPRGG